MNRQLNPKIDYILSKAEEAGFPATVMMPYLPEVVGRNDLRYVPGKGAGLAAIDIFLERANISATDDQKKRILAVLKARSVEIKRFLSEEEFAELAKEVIAKER